ncbi:MAG: hypothetical protein ABSF44_12215 [Candidatus Bathyarchaeia archaeon]|jgi:hypothetical protein
MVHQSIRKVPHKINEGTVHLIQSMVNPSGNHTRRKIMTAATCLLAIVVFSAVVAALATDKTIVYANPLSSLGAGVYWDQACTNRTLSLVWGAMEPGSNSTLTIYVRNEGNSAASLTLQTSNWNPPIAMNYLSLKWNYTGQVLSTGQVIPLELTLTVSPTITGITNFNFGTLITTSHH